MVVERTKKEIIFRVSSSMKASTIRDISDFIEFQEVVKKSKASQKDIDQLVKEVKKERWLKTKVELGL
jgi:hypothetical protein